MYNARYLQPQVSTVGLIVHYKLWDGPTTTGKVFDYALNGHGGTLQGTSPTFKYPGIDLPGTNEYIEIPDHDDFTPALTPFSISEWVYMHDATGFKIASKGTYNTDGEWDFGTTIGADEMLFRQFYESVASCYIGRKSSVALTSYENQWIHLIATSDGGVLSSGIRLYVNAVRVDDTDFEKNAGSFVTVENLTAPVYVGRYDTSYANGLIDDVMIFSKELSATEAKSIYEVTRQRYGV